MEEAFDFWGTPEGDLVHPAECMEQLLEKVRRHRVNIDGNVCTVMVTTLVLEVIIFLHFTRVYWLTDRMGNSLSAVLMKMK